MDGPARKQRRLARLPQAKAAVKKKAEGKKSQKQKFNLMLDGIRTRNPQIRSLVRYPLRHEHLMPQTGGLQTPWPVSALCIREVG